MILATQTHDVDAAREPLKALFLDADMAVLATPEERYARYSEAVEDEFSFMPRETFYQARLEMFLDPMLEKDVIFLLPENEERFGARARQNLRREKLRLEHWLRHPPPSMVPKPAP